MGRPPLRQAIREEDVERPMRNDVVREEPKKKRRNRFGMNGNAMDIPVGMIPPGIDLQWGSDNVKGDFSIGDRLSLEQDAWEPVTQDMWEHLFDGRWMRKGAPGEIKYGSSVLLWRPLELTLEARAEDHNNANRAVGAQERSVRAGGDNNALMDGNHPVAAARSRLTREVKPPIDIPRD